MQSHLEQFVKDELPQHLQKFQQTTSDTMNQIQTQQAQVQQLIDKFAALMTEIQDEAKLPDLQALGARISGLQKRVDKIYASSKAQLAKSQEAKQQLQSEAEKSKSVVQKDVDQLNDVFGGVFF